MKQWFIISSFHVGQSFKNCANTEKNPKTTTWRINFLFPTVFMLFSGFDIPLSKRPGCLHLPQRENGIKKSIPSYLEGQTLY